MPNLAQGRIVRTKTLLPDPQGRNPKDRPYIILNLPESIANGDKLELVAVTSTVGRTEEAKENEVELEYANPPKKCFTKLNRKSVALCVKVYVVEQSEAIPTGGFVSAEHVAAILRIIKAK